MLPFHPHLSAASAAAFVDWNERERIAVIVTARTPDFRPIYATAMRSMFS